LNRPETTDELAFLSLGPGEIEVFQLPRPCAASAEEHHQARWKHKYRGDNQTQHAIDHIFPSRNLLRVLCWTGLYYVIEKIVPKGKEIFYFVFNGT
jgi:hypothetical protein